MKVKLVLLSKQGDVFYWKEGDLHTHLGFVKEGVIKKSVNQVVTTNKGVELFVLKPEFADLLLKVKRGPAIILPKDVGFIIASTGIGKQSLVVDAGTGTGFLAALLSRVAGRVVSYEIRKDFHELAKKNLNFLGVDNVELKLGDVYKQIEERNVDLITLDLKEPWKALPQAVKALKPGAFIACYTPQITQALQVKQALPENLLWLKTVELLEREWVVDGKVLRPRIIGRLHTGFITLLRKVFE
ncbi:methyltransferase domain-containing protein [Candidatus Woesearchaeota archaeon]|nr:methyltransferase domain-containing protein [Candidatus Woesearchaeota archaeon]